MKTIQSEHITISKVSADDECVTYTALYGDQEIGYLTAVLYPTAADLEDITVYPDYRGNRIASALFRSFIQDVVDKGIKEISAAISNERSAHLIGSLETNSLTFDHEGESLQNMSIKILINKLQKARKKEQLRRKNMRDDDKISTLVVRVTAYIK